MRKRYAVVDAAACKEKIQAGLGKKDVELRAIAKKDPWPAGATALLCSPDELPAAFALAQGVEQLYFTLADAIDCRESLVHGTSRRVMEHASRFAVAGELDPTDRMILERGALLRDIGKLQVPNSVLLKDSVLSYDDWLLLKKHSHLGASLVSEMPLLSDLTDIIRHHHEYYDGTGYPDGIAAKDLPITVQMLSIVDVYCAMTSARMYRKGHASHKAAVAHLESERGKHFNPKLIDLFISAKIGKTKGGSDDHV